MPDDVQMATGYTVAYLVYTIGTLFTAPASLNVTAAIVGLIAVLAMVGVVIKLIRNTNNKMKVEYALNASAN